MKDPACSRSFQELGRFQDNRTGGLELGAESASPLVDVKVKRYKISDLMGSPDAPHALAGLVPGRRIYHGGLSFHPPGKVTHNEERPHVEVDHEVFCLLQGEGWIEINGRREPAAAGDVFVIEPGEDHHLISSDHNPFINLWLHADDHGNPLQFR